MPREIDEVERHRDPSVERELMTLGVKFAMPHPRFLQSTTAFASSIAAVDLATSALVSTRTCGRCGSVWLASTG